MTEMFCDLIACRWSECTRLRSLVLRGEACDIVCHASLLFSLTLRAKLIKTHLNFSLSAPMRCRNNKGCAVWALEKMTHGHSLKYQRSIFSSILHMKGPLSSAVTDCWQIKGKNLNPWPLHWHTGFVRLYGTYQHPLKGRVTENQCKVVLGDRLYLFAHLMLNTAGSL